MSASVAIQGFERLPQVLPEATRQHFLNLLGPVARAGRRDSLRIAEMGELARSPGMTVLVQAHLPGIPRLVRALYFDKSPDTNWLVPWHQDLTLAVRERREAPGFGPWSMKDGIPHVQPPVALLGQMITLRLHLDDCDGANGALKVLPGTHLAGRLSAEAIQTCRKHVEEVLCIMSAGDALLMRPLLLHASGRSTSARHRRVLHLEYAGFDLPSGLEWHEGGHDD